MPPASSPQAWLVLMMRFFRTSDLIRSGCSSGAGRRRGGGPAVVESRTDIAGSGDVIRDQSALAAEVQPILLQQIGETDGEKIGWRVLGWGLCAAIAGLAVASVDPCGGEPGGA